MNAAMTKVSTALPPYKWAASRRLSGRQSRFPHTWTTTNTRACEPHSNQHVKRQRRGGPHDCKLFQVTGALSATKMREAQQRAAAQADTHQPGSDGRQERRHAEGG